MATSRHQTTTEGGYTLLELMVVILLISGLAGIGLGMLTRSGNDLERTTSVVRDFARLARARARFYRAPARVIVDPAPGVALPPGGEARRTIRIVALEPVAEWNFDRGRATASRGLGGRLGGATIGEGGRFGQGLFPDPDAQANGVMLDARTLPAFDLRDGFVVRCDVKLRERRPATVLRLGEVFELGIGATGRLRGAVTMARETGQAGRRIVLAGVRPVPLGEWVKIELAVDGLRARLRRDFIEEDVEPVHEIVYRDPEARFTISDAGAPVAGVIDTVEVLAFHVIAEEELPEFVDIVEGPAVLHFDAEGMIDLRLHASLPRYRLTADGGEETVGFELGGLTR